MQDVLDVIAVFVYDIDGDLHDTIRCVLWTQCLRVEFESLGTSEIQWCFHGVVGITLDRYGSGMEGNLFVKTFGVRERIEARNQNEADLAFAFDYVGEQDSRDQA